MQPDSAHVRATVTAVELARLVSVALEAARKAGGGEDASGVRDAAEEGRAVDALRVLGQQRVTAALLAETEAGKRLKKLGKHPSAKVADASAAAIQAWKECIRKEVAASGGAATGSTGSQPPAGRVSCGPTSGATPVKEGSTGSQQQQGSGAEPGEAGGPGGSDSGGATLSRAYSNKVVIDPARTGDETRDKIRKLLAEALALALGPGVFGDPSAAAVSTEQALFVQNGGVTQRYKAKFRSLSFNLKDPKNPDLRTRVLTGEIPGDVLVTLSAEEMASSEMRAKNEQIRESMKNEAVRGQQSQASTDMFQCGKCKQRKCTYYQLQTRSADEPMTTFVTCTNCGNRWKFC